MSPKVTSEQLTQGDHDGPATILRGGQGDRNSLSRIERLPIRGVDPTPPTWPGRVPVNGVAFTAARHWATESLVRIRTTPVTDSG